MTSTTSTLPGLLTIDPELLSSLKATMSGTLIMPGDPDYETARAVWNGMIDRRPAVIARPFDELDVQRCVAFGASQGLPISVKGGGHNVAGHAVCNGGIMIDLVNMRSVRVDPAARIAWVEGGATWSDVDRATAPHGLATTGGVISSTGVAGLTLGGGIGWLVGKHGMAIDNLRSITVVTASGEIVTASGTSHPDLFWALRGGGGNFGVATSFEFSLYPVPEVYAGYFAYPISEARKVFDCYKHLTETAPDELTSYAELSFEPESEERVMAVAIFWPGDPAEIEPFLRPFRALEPLAEELDTMPYDVWQSAFDEQFPSGRRYYWKSHLLEALDEGALEAVVQHGVEPPHELYNITIEWYRGALNRIDPVATAFAHRQAKYQIIAVGQSDSVEDDVTSRAWTHAVHRDIQPFSIEGSFLNFMSFDRDERDARTRAGYGGNWERLSEIKRQYDPLNHFNHNNNILPG